MKLWKTILHIFLRLAFSAALLAAAWFVLNEWITIGTLPEQVALIYTENTAGTLDYQAVADALLAQDLQVQKGQTTDWEAQAKQSLEAGVKLLIIGADHTPKDTDLLDRARQANATLLFAGVYPGADYLSAYDKAYYIGSQDAYAGEIAGREISLAFRAGNIPDKNKNLLLDYLTTADAHTMLDYALTECDHYGIYMDNCMPKETPGETPDTSTLSAQAAALAMRWAGTEKSPELILCEDITALQAAQEYAVFADWTDVAYVTFAANETQAAQAQALGCGTVVYYDVQAVTQVIDLLTAHLLDQTSITEGLEYAPDDSGAVWLPYQIYCTAAVLEESTPEAA